MLARPLRSIAISSLFAFAGIAIVALAQPGNAAAPSKATANQMVSARPRSDGANAANESTGERITVRGQVFAPDGKPAFGAEVLVFFHRYTTAVPTRLQLAATRTDAIGRYQLSFHKPRIASDIVLFGNPEVWKSMTCIIARQAGYGPDAARWNEVDTTQPVNLKLVPNVPLQGRLVDLEGRPVSRATVEVQGIFGPRARNSGSTSRPCSQACGPTESSPRPFPQTTALPSRRTPTGDFASPASAKIASCVLCFAARRLPIRH